MGATHSMSFGKQALGYPSDSLRDGEMQPSFLMCMEGVVDISGVRQDYISTE